jgi:hypothetical protein
MGAFIEYKKAVRMQPLPFRVQVVITSDLSRSVVQREKQVGKYEPNTVDYALQCEDIRSGGVCHLFLPINVDAGTIAHEAYHAVRTMLRFVGSEKEEELVAYHLGYLVRAIHRLAMRAK